MSKIEHLGKEVSRISAPGFYMMGSEQYYADCCPSPSLTQSIAKTLIAESPAHARLEHVRLNPNYEATTRRNMELGTAAHAMLIGRGKDIVVVEHDTYMSKAAKAARDEAIEAGKTPVLTADYETAVAMVQACRRQLDMIDGCERAFREGHGELVLAWREDDLWLRTQIDWTDPGEQIIWDFKTTATSAAPHKLSTSIPDKGLDIQAAMFERGLGMLDPETYGRWRFRFVLQENFDPYALSVIELDAAAMMMGQKKLGHAIDIWRRCTAADFWPAYPLAITRPEYPIWAESQWLAREVAFHDIAGTPLDPFHAVMGAATRSKSDMLTEIVG